MTEKTNRKRRSISNGKDTTVGRQPKVTAVHATGAPAFVTVAAPATFFALPLAGALLPGTPLDTTADATSNLDKAASCCWTGSPTYYCFDRSACAKGEYKCHSPYFTASNGFYTGYMVCTVEMGTRGDAAKDALVADPAPRLFVAPRGVDMRPETTARLRTLTAVTRLQYLAAMEPELAEKKYADPRGALADLGIEIPAEIEVSIVRDEDSGEDVVTVEGFGNSEELRYAADGTLIQPEAEESE
jgi:hypothetical protein